MENARLLVVDDEESMCKFMQIFLSKEGYEVTATADPADAVKKIEKEDFDLLIADLMMPEMSGLELLARAKGIDPGLHVIVMTAFASVDSAIEALKKGASDYVTKPFKIDEIKIAIQKTLDQKKIVRENASLKRQLKKEFQFDNFIGTSPQVLEMKKLADRVAVTDSTVLIRGESGTGKELVARAIHNHSFRSGKPFVSINCAALPETLLESELFGHTRGAFTGAVKEKEGLFKVADGGTFLLDEVGETSPAIQVKLLRVLEEKEITPLGSTKPVPVDVRLIASTNADLEQDVKFGKFRADLYYRLNVIPVVISPLRERKEDIKLLASYFLKRLSEREKSKVKGISEAGLKILSAYHWPGNVRELENVIEQAFLLCKKEELEPEDLPERVKLGDAPQLVEEAAPPTPTLEEVEKAYIYWTLEKTSWQKSKAAQILGIDASTLYRKIERYQFKEK